MTTHAVSSSRGRDRKSFEFSVSLNYMVRPVSKRNNTHPAHRDADRLGINSWINRAAWAEAVETTKNVTPLHPVTLQQQWNEQGLRA